MELEVYRLYIYKKVYKSSNNKFASIMYIISEPDI